jgi:hypothetical protein
MFRPTWTLLHTYNHHHFIIIIIITIIIITIIITISVNSCGMV